MELRLRNYESKETQRLQVPPPCSFHQLRQTLSRSLPRSLSPYSIRFSLNAKDVLQPPSPLTPLQSLGVAPGGLLFFSLDPKAFSAVQDPNQTPESSFSSKDATPVQEMYQLQESTSQETLTAHIKRLSNPYFLMKVLCRELDDYGNIPKLLAVAVHAVLLDSGFLGFDPVSGLQTDRFPMRDVSPRPFSLCYSLPELLRDGLIDYVVLKFLTLDRFILVYGFLAIGSGIHRLCLDATHLAAVLSDCGTSNDGFFNSNVEKQVSEFWKIVKDGFAWPLLIDLCYKTGLPLPACFPSLPHNLLRKILEALPAPAIARMACVCRELRSLASEEKLWKHKFREEFGEISERVGIWSWKFLFHSNWESRKIRVQNQNQALMGPPRVNDRAFHFPMQRDPTPIFHPFGVHAIFASHFGLPYFPPNIYLPAPPPHPFLPFQGPWQWRGQVQVQGRGQVQVQVQVQGQGRGRGRGRGRGQVQVRGRGQVKEILGHDGNLG